jgi:hypothetical protein
MRASVFELDLTSTLRAKELHNAMKTTLMNTTESRAPEHKFKVGQSVNLSVGPFGQGSAGAVYKIVRLLPSEGGDHQYRVKSTSEPHERVANESQLSRIL